MKISGSKAGAGCTKPLPAQKPVLFFIILTIVFLGVQTTMAKKMEPNEVCQVIEPFINASKQYKITRIESYYYSWNVLTYAAITEDHLVNKGCHFKVISYDPDTSELVKVLEKFGFEKADRSHFDLRMGFIFYSEEQEILRIFFAKYADVVVINGVPFKNSSDILKSLVPYLPVKAYFDIYQEMKEQRGLLLPIPACSTDRKPSEVKK